MFDFRFVFFISFARSFEFMQLKIVGFYKKVKLNGDKK